MDNSQTPNPTPKEEIDLLELWTTVVKEKALILKITLASLTLATAAAFLMTPKYEAKVTASFATQERGAAAGLAGQFGGLADLAGVSLGGNADNDANFAFLTSRGFIEGFITENNLLSTIFDKRWDEETKTWKKPLLKFWKEDASPSIWEAYEQFSERIVSVSMDKKTSIITLTILWKDREQAVAWANGLIQKANETLRQRTIEETQRSLDYLNKELAKTSVVDVQNTIFKVMENQIKTMMMANTKDEFAFKIIDPAIVVDEDAFVKPKRPMIIAFGLFGGLFLGIAAAFIRKAINNRQVKATS